MDNFLSYYIKELESGYGQADPLLISFPPLPNSLIPLVCPPKLVSSLDLLVQLIPYSLLSNANSQFVPSSMPVFIPSSVFECDSSLPWCQGPTEGRETAISMQEMALLLFLRAWQANGLPAGRCHNYSKVLLSLFYITLGRFHHRWIFQGLELVEI